MLVEWEAVSATTEERGDGFAFVQANLRKCPICAAVVPVNGRIDHLQWHETLHPALNARGSDHA